MEYFVLFLMWVGLLLWPYVTWKTWDGGALDFLFALLGGFISMVTFYTVVAASLLILWAIYNATLTLIP